MKAIDKMTDNPPQEGLSGRKIIYDEDGKPYVGLRKANSGYTDPIKLVIFY